MRSDNINKNHIKNEILKIYNKICELIYPPCCGICNKLNKEYLCIKCENMLKQEYKIQSEEIKSYYKNFDNLIYCFKYQGIIRASLINYKFNEKSYMYKTFCEILLKDKNVFEILKSYDTIIPVPISEKRKKKRGYNQVGLIAKELAKRVGIDYKENILLKIKDTKEQSSLNKEERIENVKNVYMINVDTMESLKNKKILLVDDIYTTGNTVNECAKELKQIYLKKLDVFVIAKD